MKDYDMQPIVDLMDSAIERLQDIKHDRPSKGFFWIPEPKQYLPVIATAFEITLPMLYMKTRERETVQARQFAMWYMQEHLRLGPNQVGREFGLNHATAVHARKTIINLIDTGDSWFGFSTKAHRALTELKAKGLYRKYVNINMRKQFN